MKNHTPTFKASNTSETLTRHSQARVHCGTQNAVDTNASKTQRSQQNKTNMESHRSLKRTLLQAEIQRNSEKQRFTYSDSKKNSKEIPKHYLQPT
jgi:hypothetical protein